MSTDTNETTSTSPVKLSLPTQLREVVMMSDRVARAEKCYVEAVAVEDKVRATHEKTTKAVASATRAKDAASIDTPDAEVRTLISDELFAVERARHAADALKKAESATKAAHHNIGEAEKAEARAVVKRLAIDPIVALEREIAPLVARVIEMQREQSALFLAVVVPLQPQWQRTLPPWAEQAPADFYEDIADVLARHANIPRPVDVTDPMQSPMIREDVARRAAYSAADAVRQPVERFATLADFSEDDVDRLIHCLDTLGSGFAGAARLQSGNLPLHQLYSDVAGVDLRNSDRQPAGMSAPRADVTPQLLAEILYAVGEGGPAFVIASKARPFDQAAVRRRRAILVPGYAPSRPST